MNLSMSKLVEHVQHTNTVCIVSYGDKKFSTAILSIMTLSILAELLHSARHVVQSTFFKKNLSSVIMILIVVLPSAMAFFHSKVIIIKFFSAKCLNYLLQKCLNYLLQKCLNYLLQNVMLLYQLIKFDKKDKALF